MSYDSRIHNQVQPNLWVGIPDTAQNTLPPTMGLAIGTQDGRGRIRIQGGTVTNVTAGAAGIAGLFADAQWVAGFWTTATSTYSDDTTDAQDAGADDFVLSSTVTNNGFIVGCNEPFNVITARVTTAAGGSPANAYAYWGIATNGSGSAGWQTVSTNLITNVFTSTGEALLVLNFPLSLMRVTVAADITGFPIGLYAVRVIQSTAATTTTGTSSRIYVGREIMRVVSAGANSENAIAGGIGASARTVDGIVAIQSFHNTAAASNHLYLEYV